LICVVSVFLLAGSSRQILQMPPRKRQKPRRRPDVFIQRITFFIGGHHGRAFDIRQTRLELFERGANQFAKQFFRVAFGVHLGNRRQSRSGLDVQMNRVAGVGQATLGVFFPMLGEFTNFHDDLISRLLVAGLGECPAGPAASRCAACY